MSRLFLTLLSDIALFLFFVFLPLMWFVFSDRLRQPPSARQFAVLLAIACVAGALLFVPTIAVVSATGLLALIVAWLSGRYALAGFSYRRTLDPARLFAGDRADLVLHLKNDKLLPLAWLSISDPIHGSVIRLAAGLDESLLITGGFHEQDDLSRALSTHTAIGPFQEIKRTFTITGVHRGVYSLGPAVVESGDPFGLFTQEAHMGGVDQIIVYPRVYSANEINFPFRQVMGEMTTRRALFEDPTLIAGSRDYRPGDPLKRIHWKSTARTGDMQVRIFDPSTTAQLMLVVNLNTHQHVWEGVDADRMEAAISAAASIGIWSLQHDFAVGLRSNGTMVGAEGSPRLPISANPQQSIKLLEHLARLSFAGYYSPEFIIADETRRLAPGTSIVFVTSMINADIINVLSSRKLAGRVAVVYCGRHAAPLIRGLHVHLFTVPEDVRAVS